jgi:hypothetical protein
MAVQGVSWSGVALRLVLAVALVLVTFNPSGHSFYHWLMTPPLGITATKAFLSVALVVAWVVCLRTAYSALGMLGVVLGCLLLGTFVWMLFDMNLLRSDGRQTMVWLGLIVFGAVLGLGLSWSLIRARATGQIDVH